MRETLVIPEKCADCPLAVELRERFHVAYVDAETELRQRELAIQLIEETAADIELSEEKITQGRKNVFKAAGDVLNDAENQQAQIQSNANLMTMSCEGTMQLRGKNNLGKDVLARVCGSPIWHGDTTEYAHIQRP